MHIAQGKGERDGVVNSSRDVEQYFMQVRDKYSVSHQCMVMMLSNTPTWDYFRLFFKPLPLLLLLGAVDKKPPCSVPLHAHGCFSF